MKKILANFSRVLVGLIFIFSGYVKVIDPLGSAYKFTDYFNAMHLSFMTDASLFFAIVMSVAELVIGLCLVFNILPKLASWGVLLFMLFFTPLTLWLAVANPVHDCGCFGDALVLTNWQTFYKNIVILIFVIFIFIYRNKFKSIYNTFFQWIIAGLFTIMSVWLSFYCLKNLPIIDFRPYHIGANIIEGMTVPEDQINNVDVYESVFIYEKDGVQKEFKVDNLPDSTWKFVDAKHKLVKEGYKPPIHDFTITPVYIPGHSPEHVEAEEVNLYDAEFMYTKNGETEYFTIDHLPDSSWKFEHVVYKSKIDPSLIRLVYLNPEGIEEVFNFHSLPGQNYTFIDAFYFNNYSGDYHYGDDITDRVLADKNYYFIAVMYDLKKADKKYLDRLNNVAKYCQENSYNFYCLTASNENDISEFVAEHKPVYQFYNTDPITLKTIVRSNPGLLLLKDATIIDKWAARNIPDFQNFKGDLQRYSLSKQRKYFEDMRSGFILFSLLLFMSLFTNFYNWMKNNKYINNN
jgi:uncharacterized membrane protein YphA (DoxX/SURF4 family)